MKTGDRIRITEMPRGYEFFSEGDVATVISAISSEDMHCDFTCNKHTYDRGKWFVGKAVNTETSYEVIEIFRPNK